MADTYAVYPVPDAAEPATRALIERANAAELPYLHDLTPEAGRAGYRKAAARTNFDPAEVGTVEDIAVPADGRQIPVRLYRPPKAPDGAPMLVYFHGGGFVIGDLETHDPVCRRICAEAGAVVAAVDYRLAPEHRFPAAVEDALVAFDWLAPKAAAFGADPDRRWVGGDSAGGTLAAVVARRTADEGGPGLAGQVLIYPALDRAGAYPSRSEFDDVFPIPAPTMAWFDRHYFRTEADKESPLASPGRAAPTGREPPALIQTAELDPLRDEGAAYAERLSQAGVAVRYHCFAGTVHGFIDKGRLLPVAGEAVAEIAAVLRGQALA